MLNLHFGTGELIKAMPAYNLPGKKANYRNGILVFILVTVVGLVVQAGDIHALSLDEVRVAAERGGRDAEYEMGVGVITRERVCHEIMRRRENGMTKQPNISNWPSPGPLPL